jgi:Tfp pilus assembly protein PilF
MPVKDYGAATALLEPLATQQNQHSPSSSPSSTSSSSTTTMGGELRSALGRVYLQSGQLDKAEAHFAQVAADPNVPEASKALNAAFVASARGDWPAAGEILRRLVEEDDANYAVRVCPSVSPSCSARAVLAS